MKKCVIFLSVLVVSGVVVLGDGVGIIVQGARAPLTVAGGNPLQEWDTPAGMVLLVTGNLVGSYSQDASGFGNTGVVSGATQLTIGTNTNPNSKYFGRIKKAWSFDGVDDRVTIPNSGSLNPSQGPSLHTSAMWIWKKLSRDQGVWSKGEGNGNWQYGWYTLASSSLLWGWAEDKNQAWGPYWSRAFSEATGRWDHVVFTVYNSLDLKTSGTLYTNGFICSTFTNADTVDIAVDTDHLDIGDDCGQGTLFSGVLTDIRVFSNVCLTPIQVYDLWWNTGGEYTNQPWMSNENGY